MISLTVRGAHLQIRAQLALTLVRGMDFHLSGNINIVNSAHLRRQTSWKLTRRFLPWKKKSRLQMCHKKKRKISHAKKQPVVLDLEPPNMAVSLCPEKYLGGSGKFSNRLQWAMWPTVWRYVAWCSQGERRCIVEYWYPESMPTSMWWLGSAGLAHTCPFVHAMPPKRCYH